MLDLEMDLIGSDEVISKLQDIANFVGMGTGIPQKIILDEGRWGIRMNFMRQSSPAGVPWRPRQEAGGGHKLLMDTKTLYNSITGMVVGDSVVFESTDPKGPSHNDGLTIKPKGKFLAILMPGVRWSGDLRSQFPGAFVLKLGGRFYGSDKLWLVRKLAKADYGTDNSYMIGKRGKLQFIALLVRNVTEPVREFMGLPEFAIDRIFERFGQAIQKIWGDDADAND